MTARPLALSLGDPAGVGPEITAKAWAALRHSGPAFMVVGDATLLPDSRQVGGPDEAARVFSEAIPILHRPCAGAVTPGVPAGHNAPAVIDWIETGVKLALDDAVGGLVTAPIAKAPLYEAGFKFPGHTEFLAKLTEHAPMAGARGPVMMLTAGDLRVCLVTIHEPVARVPELLTVERIVHAGQVTAEALKRDFGVENPRIAVPGLNPHAGESGSIGREEVEVIGPAVGRLRAMGINASGPSPADTLFHAEARAAYDAALCMYHDQALIPVKMLDFWGGVNVTLGLPIVRTSPDHGAGFDIAGKGVTRPDSLIAAIRLADMLARRRASLGTPRAP